MPKQNQNPDYDVDENKKPKQPETQPAPALKQTGQEAMPTLPANTWQTQASSLDNGNIPLLQRQALAGEIGLSQGNQHLAQIMRYRHQDDDAPRPKAKTNASPQISLGSARIVNEDLGNGQIQQTQRLPFSVQIPIARSADEAEETENEPEAPLHLDEIALEEEALNSSLDSIMESLTFNGSLIEGGISPPGFGRTESSARWVNIDIKNFMYFYVITGELEATTNWAVRSSLGPSGQVDIPNEFDSAITANNYLQVVGDLTPDMSDLNGRPPRFEFWAEDITEVHELFHANEHQDFMEQGLTVAKNWLGEQEAESNADVEAHLTTALGQVSQTVNAGLTPPGDEERAYGDGVPLYQARADAIEQQAEAGAYDYTVVAGDTLWAIALYLYGEGRRWRDLYDLNRDTIDNPNVIQPGQVLNVPPL